MTPSIALAYRPTDKLDLGARFTLADTGAGDREATGVIALGLLVGG